MLTRRFPSALATVATFAAVNGACTAILGTFDFAGAGGESSTTHGSTTGSGGATGSSGSGTCVIDGKRDGNETGVDCGGPDCPPCGDGSGCTLGSDCVDKVCMNGTCLASTCMDQVQNGTETDVDCGGKCPPCAYDKHCAVNADCKSMLCTSGTCAASCNDGQQDGMETGVDCGGPTCMPCDDNMGCLLPRDCKNVCKNMTCTPVAVWSESFDTAPMGAGAWTTAATDTSGNVLTLGFVSGTVDLGGGAYGMPGNLSAFYADFTSAGAFSWGSPLTSLDPAELAFDASNKAYLVGAIISASAYGSCPGPANANNPTSSPVFVTFDASGNWASCAQFGVTGDGAFNGLRFDAQGNRYLLGSLNGTLAFGTTQVTGTSNSDWFVVKLDPTGKLLWSKVFPAASISTFEVDPAGNVFVATTSATPVSLGGPMISGNGLAIAKLDPSGAYLWGEALADMGPNAPIVDSVMLKADAQGNLFVAGYFYTQGGTMMPGGLDFGGGPITSNGREVYVGKLDPTGKYLWAKAFGGDGYLATLEGFALNAKGGPVLIGTFGGSIDFGGGPLVATGNGSGALFLGVLDGTGAYVWSRGFGENTAMTDVGNASITIDSSGEALVAGAFTGTLDFGNKPLTTPDGGTGESLFLAKLNLP